MASERRLIDANALKAEFPVIGNFKDDLWHSATIRVAIDNASTVDAVEVVRCKDCKNGRQPWLEGQTMVKCMVGKTMLVTPDHFCSYGERKDNG